MESIFAIVATGQLQDMIISGLSLHTLSMPSHIIYIYILKYLIRFLSSFRDSNCDLFQQEEIIAWEARMNARQVLGQINAEIYAGRADTCPNCRQLNAKVSVGFPFQLSLII